MSLITAAPHPPASRVAGGRESGRSRLQRKPFQLISVMVAAGELLDPPETTKTGLRHSCRLMSPWAEEVLLPVLKQAAQRTHLLAVRCLGSSAVGSPSGQNSQLWSEMAFTEGQPASRCFWIRSASRSISGWICRGRSIWSCSPR